MISIHNFIQPEYPPFVANVSESIKVNSLKFSDNFSHKIKTALLYRDIKGDKTVVEQSSSSKARQ